MSHLARPPVTALVLLLAGFAASGASAQDSPTQAPLAVTVSSGDWLGADEPLVLALTRPPAIPAEQLVVTIGTRDITPQMTRQGTSWRFRNRGVPIETGRHALVVRLITADTIVQILVEREIRVEGAFGIREQRVSRTAEAGVKSRLQNGAAPDRPPTDRDTYNDGDGQLGIGLALEGRDYAFTLRSAMVGTSYRPNALRYGVRRDKAPLVDLSSFLAQYRRGPAELAVGHLSVGNQRHLLNGFSSRGVGVRLSKSRVDASIAALNGSSLVGWDDVLGFTTPDHRVLNAMLGVEVLPTAGALRIEASALKGSVLPISGFTQGAVTDAETSDGAALRVQSAFWSRRVRLEAGFARSTFDNPGDRLLGPVDSLVRVARETRDARYLESSVDLVRAVPLFAGRTASLTVGAAHERVDPLYRSVGTFIQSDRLQDRVSARGSIAGVSLGAVHAVGENNVARIPSILTTRSAQTTADLSAPLAAVLGQQGPWWPAVSARVMRNHHEGVRLPTNGGFDPSHVPDQLSDDRTLSLTWQAARGTITLAGGRSEQDNRQPGRERADLRNTTRGAQLSLMLHRHFSIATDAAWTRAQTLERDVTERIQRLGFTGSLFPSSPVSVALQFADARARTPAEGRARDDLQWSAQLALRLPSRLGMAGRAFVRYQSQQSEARDPNYAAPIAFRTYLLDSGLTLSFP